ncbi:type I-B CRISPR-associated protein Cas8b1/Cst1 [Sporolactobacillus sp. KGMB 08714]|uniref:type I-B CRISPR-associated protein Cas8b1/Cst1 n=1 Tax=Sporolactobacillus sp. KGMB 08714 TaxID=3064704 RepID=UPI002FBDA743
MSEIVIPRGTWLENAGIIGVCNVLDRADLPFDLNANRLIIDSVVLEHFGTAYFDSFKQRYEVFLSPYVIKQKGNLLLERRQWDKEGIDQLNKYIDWAKSKLTSNSYVAAYRVAVNGAIEIRTLAKALKKINLKKNQTVEDVQPAISEELSTIGRILELLTDSTTWKLVMAKQVSYSIINQFWSNVSMLNRNAADQDPIVAYETYFIDPLKNYLKEDHQKDKYCCLTCNQPIKKLSKPAAFDLTWLNKMGVDMTRKTSHFWNLNAGTSYICPVCNFILSCVPAGFSVLKGQGYLVNSSSDLFQMRSLNDTAKELNAQNDETINLLELRSYYQLIDLMEQGKAEQEKREIDNIQIIKFNSADSLRPYTFNVLSKDKLEIIQRNKKSLDKLIKAVVRTDDGDYLNIYQQVFKRLYDNKNQFDLIQKIYRSSIPEQSAAPLKNAFIIRQLIYINNDFIYSIRKRGGEQMSDYSPSYVPKPVINQMIKAGQKLATVYIKDKSVNKLQGITYRLLNALKTKNTSRFMDTFFNAYLYVKNTEPGSELIIPLELSDALHDEDKLQTLGYAFILGFRSGRGLKEEED